jgi:hypothetical protein
VDAGLGDLDDDQYLPVASAPGTEVPAPRRPIDDVLVDDSEAALEPTQSLPVLRGLLHPTKEMPPRDEGGSPWWRRNRETGVA